VPVHVPRRAIFIDVENTSSESELGRVLDGMAIDVVGGATEVTAIGNWRVVGQELARALARRGAHLVHSAPVTRVPDWSDLWIAVSAGIWLGQARPGDTLEIVSHDRAFDAVGDAAARLGVAFRRITYRGSASAHAREVVAPPPSGRRRRRRGGRAERGESPAVQEAAGADAAAGGEPLAASLEQIREAIASLTTRDPAKGTGLDALTLALKAAGFGRPPGSPRLITRLRLMKDVEVLPDGRVRLVGGDAAGAHAEPASTDGARPRRSSRRRGGRGGRRRRGRKTAAPTVS
jgi:hypothetical protein